MPSPNPSFFVRVLLAFGVFFRLLWDAAFASRVQRLASVSEPEPTPNVPRVSEPPKLREAPTDSALQLLGLLQRDGRLIDFLHEDISQYADAEIGAAARVVHDQCKKALDAHLSVERIRTEREGSAVSVPKGFSTQEIRLVGNVLGEAPFSGTLQHAGWRVKHIALPQLAEGHDLHVLAPAEVEL